MRLRVSPLVILAGLAVSLVARVAPAQEPTAAADSDRAAGPLAMVWLPYDFYVNGEWSHCGVDAFILLRTGDGWRIASIGWTVEQPPACRPHPDGSPSG